MYTITTDYADGSSGTVELGWSRTLTVLRDQQTSPDPNVSKIRVQRIVDGAVELSEDVTFA
jgi:hypothetical protein